MEQPRRSEGSSEQIELYRRFRQPLLAYFLRKGCKPDDAEDLVQEVFLRVTRKEGTAVVAADAYIFTIAVNLLRDRAREGRSRGGPSTSLDASELAHLPSALVEHLEPERIYAGRQSLADVLRVLGALETRTRDIFILYRFENLSRREIADHYAISVSAVEKHIAKAAAHMTREIGR